MTARSYRAIDWKWIATRLTLIVVGAYSVTSIALMLIDPPPRWDWINLSAIVELENPYEVGYGFRWSPVAAWLLEPVVAAGWWLYVAAHFAVLVLLRDWRVIIVVLLAWPFWVDVMWGNTVTFIFVAAYVALSGSRSATLVFYALTLLVPRPLMLPVAGYLLWKRPDTRVLAAVILVVHAALVLLSGLGEEWLAFLFTASTELEHVANYAPSRFIGVWWIPVGAAVSVYLTLRGRVGLAALAAQPYWLPYYLLMLLLEFRPARRVAAAHGPDSR